MTAYYGFTSGSGEWWNGRLLEPCGEHEGGYIICAGHVSSSAGWSEVDIRNFHAKKVMVPGDTFEWLGIVTADSDADAWPFRLCTKADHGEVDESEAVL